MPQANQSCDIEWQRAKVTVLPEGFPLYVKKILIPPWQAYFGTELSQLTRDLGWGGVGGTGVCMCDPGRAEAGHTVQKGGCGKRECLEAWLGRKGWCRVRR